MNFLDQLYRVKQSSHGLLFLEEKTRKQILISLAETLRDACPKIIYENKKDLTSLPESDPRYDRLLLTEERILALADDVEQVANLQNPLNQIMLEKVLPNGLKLQKIAVPLGVVAVIYESRPNVTIDVFTLCFKTGNACVLKGGKEATFTNRILIHLIHQVLEHYEVSKHSVFLMPPEREALKTLLEAQQLVDVCIPRGSQSLINFVREHAKIPVIETGAGIVHTYFDKSADLQKGKAVIHNAKTRRVSVCNALDTLIIHKDRLADLPALVEDMVEQNVEIMADEESYNELTKFYPHTLLFHAYNQHFGQEYLSYKLSTKTVETLAEAVQHIMHYSSGHSEAIIAENKKAIHYFVTHVDAAVVYINASTAFTDGGQFGMGAEIGISTQKLHARGPMALEALTSYKWIIYGDGHVRA